VGPDVQDLDLVAFLDESLGEITEAEGEEGRVPGTAFIIMQWLDQQDLHFVRSPKCPLQSQAFIFFYIYLYYKHG
jgi:hypothetical protein